MNHEKKEFIVSNGITLRYFFPGIFLLVIGGILLSNLYSGGVIVCLTGVILMISTEGVQFDLPGERIKKFVNFFFFKAGQWVSISGAEKVVLSQTRQSRSYNFLWRSNTVRTRSYDVYLYNKPGLKIEIKEFTDYKEAEKFLVQIAAILGIKAENKIRNAQNRSMEKRRLKR